MDIVEYYTCPASLRTRSLRNAQTAGQNDGAVKSAKSAIYWLI
jgi:hypothetical protein